MATDAQQIINKAWNYAHVLRDEGLRPGVRKRAFDGKLVPQDPKDEPASVLLARIRMGKEAALHRGDARLPGAAQSSKTPTKRTRGSGGVKAAGSKKCITKKVKLI